MILVTDDAAFMRMMLKSMLVPLGYEIDEASDGEEAVKKVRENNYELVTLDITMNNMDGIEALKQIKSIKPEVPCVMCSAMGQERMVLEAIQIGALDFIVKPFKADRIQKMIKSVLQKEG